MPKMKVIYQIKVQRLRDTEAKNVSRFNTVFDPRDRVQRDMFHNTHLKTVFLVIPKALVCTVRVSKHIQNDSEHISGSTDTSQDPLYSMMKFENTALSIVSC